MSCSILHRFPDSVISDSGLTEMGIIEDIRFSSKFHLQSAPFYQIADYFGAPPVYFQLRHFTKPFSSSRVCAVFLMDSHFMVDGAKFLSGSTIALCVMANLEVPHVNVLSKIDLLSPRAKRHLDVFLHPDTRKGDAI